MRVDHSALVVSLAQTRKHEDDEDNSGDQREEREDDQNNSNRVERSFYVLPVLQRKTAFFCVAVEPGRAEALLYVFLHAVRVADSEAEKSLNT